MIKKTVLINDVIDLLNEMLRIDRKAITTLINNRVPCNEILVNHKTIQVDNSTDIPQVGILGLLNGLFGIDDKNGAGPIACYVDSEKYKYGFLHINSFGIRQDITIPE